MKWIKKLLFLPLGLVLLFSVISAASLAAVFTRGLENSPLAYAVYVFSFYSLSAFCLFCWKTLPGYLKSLKAKLYANKLAILYAEPLTLKEPVICRFSGFKYSSHSGAIP